MNYKHLAMTYCESHNCAFLFDSSIKRLTKRFFCRFNSLQVCSTENFLSPIFFCLSEVWSMFCQGSVGKFRIKNATLCLHVLSSNFLLFFIIESVFLSFSFCFFNEISNFRNRILNNQEQELVIKSCQ